MPHPRRVDDLAEVLAQVGDRVDRYVLDHIATGARLPTDAQVLSVMAGDVEAALVAAFDDITTDWTGEELVSAREAILGELAVVIRRALRDAASRRIEATSIPQDRLQTDDSVVGWVRAGLGLGALIAAVRAKEGRLPDAGQVRYLAAVAGEPAPRRVGPVVRQIVRTRIAEERNTVAANVADRAGLVIRVEDARKGPTDEACEDVNGRYATPLWLRRHRVEHPNCTRRGRPAKLPAGQFVTLLE